MLRLRAHRCGSQLAEWMALAGVAGVQTPQVMADSLHAFHLYCVRVQGDRDAILAELNQRGIGAGDAHGAALKRRGGDAAGVRCRQVGAGRAGGTAATVPDCDSS